jgi:hypothetical protein
MGSALEKQGVRERLADSATRVRLVAAMRENLDRRGGAERLQFSRYAPDASIEGKTLRQVADARGRDAIEVALEHIAAGSAGVVSFNMDSTDIHTLMRQPWTMTASDGDLVPMGEGVPHPRAYGTFPRKLGKYARDMRTVGVEQAIRSMTSLPAAVFRMRDRGLNACLIDAPAETLPAGAGGVSVTVDQLARPGAIVSGKVTFSDGQSADWYLDQAGRLGVVPKQQGYKPPAADVQEFQLALQNELAKMGYA